MVVFDNVGHRRTKYLVLSLLNPGKEAEFESANWMRGSWQERNEDHLFAFGT